MALKWEGSRLWGDLFSASKVATVSDKLMTVYKNILIFLKAFNSAHSMTSTPVNTFRLSIMMKYLQEQLYSYNRYYSSRK